MARKNKIKKGGNKILKSILAIFVLLAIAGAIIPSDDRKDETLLSDKKTVVQNDEVKEEVKEEVKQEAREEVTQPVKEEAPKESEKAQEPAKEETVNEESSREDSSKDKDEPKETVKEEAKEEPAKEEVQKEGEEPQEVVEEVTKEEVQGELKVHFIDVGQADAILITQGDSSMLIDGGNNADSNLVVNYIKNIGIKRLEYIIGTHPHEDHIGGLDKVIDNFDVGKVIMPKVQHTTKTFEDVVQAVKNKGMKITAPKLGEEFELANAKWKILAPRGEGYDDLNDYSVVIKLSFKESDFIFTGDAEGISEREILTGGFDVDAEVLKIGHHGSDSSTTDEFLQSVSPEYAVISVGEGNKYGHPTMSTMKKLEGRSIDVYRTDECGTIVCTTDGDSISFDKNPGSYNYPQEEKEEVKVPKEEVQEEVKEETKAPVHNESKSEAEKADRGVIIQSIDKDKEIVTIVNTTSEDVDISGWILDSTLGEQKFDFPDYVLKSGESITIASGKAEGTFKWTGRYVWNNDEKDDGILKDNSGKIIFYFQDQD